MARLSALSAANWTLSAVGAAVEAGVPALLREPLDAPALAARAGLPEPLATRLAEALVAAGLAHRDGARFVADEGLAAIADSTHLRADLRTGLLQAAAFVDAATAGSLAAGWAHQDERVLQAQGDVSAGAVEALASRVLPRLDGLLERLDSGDGAFLDVGAGVASVTIELCRRHPRLRAVGLEPHAASHALALRNVEAAGMADRIEIRPQRVQEMADRDAFDLAWLPGMFLPLSVKPAALTAVHRALRPGGWMLDAAYGAGGDDMASFAGRLRAVLWGGDWVPAEQAAQMIEEAGFVDVDRLPGPPSGIIPLYARRP
jgi:SAM-dependent methyltransferase